MNVTPEDLSATRRKLVIEFTAEETAAEDRRVLQEFLPHAHLPGFRPGKAPPDRIRQRYARELQQELDRALVRKAYGQVEKSELDVRGIVEFPEVRIQPGQPARLEITLDHLPDFELPEYRGIPTRLPALAVSEEDVDSSIEQLRRSRGSFQPVERPAAEGDYVRVTYRGRFGDRPLAEIITDPNLRIWTTQENTWEEALSQPNPEVTVPAVAQALLGLKAGEQKETEQVLPADFPVAELAGQTVTYAVEALEVRERVLPEINEEFLRGMSLESLEALREQTRTELLRTRTQERDQEQRRQISEHLTESLEFPVPENLLERETQQVMARIMTDNVRRGVPAETFEQHKQELYDNSRRMALGRVKFDLILEKIATREKIELSEQDLSRAVYFEAMRHRQRPEQLVKELRKDQDRLQRLRRTALLSKTLDFLCKEATMVDQPAPSGPAPAEA